MIVLLAMAMQMDHAMSGALRIACVPAMVATNTPAGWASPAAVRSGATITPGRAVMLTLQTVRNVSFATPPARPAARGAAMTVVIPRTGRWRISLEAPVWIDLIAPGREAATSIAYTHGAPCSGIAKMVDFDVPAGRYVLQLSGTSLAPVRVMIAPA